MKANGITAVTIGAALVLATAASAENFSIPSGTLASALDAYSAQSGVPVAISAHELDGAKSRGVSGDMPADAALMKILSGTGFAVKKIGDSIAIVRMSAEHSENLRDQIGGIQLAAAQAAPAALETVTVTSSKVGGDIQNIPISITALSQEQLTATQTAGGPDLIKQVPNMTFTKTNFSGYSIQLRGIGTQAISVTTDPAVAVAFNDTPFIRNHFFEQEFYDVAQVQVLRGPQGTLYGRNATAGVVNLTSAKPTDQFEAMASADIGNYQNRRFEGMINIPIVDDRLDLRVAGEWTKRQGYSFNALDDQRIDGRDLWSGRVTLGWKPNEKIQTYIVWEHFSENDDRMRTAKQLCKTDPGQTEVGGVPVGGGQSNAAYVPAEYLSQGCLPTSLYGRDAFEVPNGIILPYYDPLSQALAPITAGPSGTFDPYASTTQSRNLRVIETQLNPIYRAKNDTLELNADYNVSPALTFSSQTGYNQDFLWSTEDYNRFNTAEGAFQFKTPNDGGTNVLGQVTPDPNGLGHCRDGASSCAGLIGPNGSCKPNPGAYIDTGAYNCLPDAVFCDPQLGCSDRLVAQDLSDE
ncbi:MAG TPA: TonB-dependent receptor, partial [Rhizomicrobium sp.]